MPLYTPRIPLIGSGQTVTASAPLLDLTQTWNNVATTFTGLKFNVTDTASDVASNLLDFQRNGTPVLTINKYGTLQAATLRTTGFLSFGSTGDTILARDAANTLALRNGTAAQKFNVYNTYTDASNYERGVFDWAGTANTLRIGTEAAGTGTVRNIQLVAGSNTVTMTPGASNLLTLNGGLVTGAGITSGGSVVAALNSSVGWLGASTPKLFGNVGDGIILATNNGATGFTRLILGTNDASGIAIVKNAQAFDFKTGDAASFVDIQSRHLFVTNVFASGYVKSQSTTVAGLTAAATAGAGARSFVTDATATTFLSTVAGGGANKVPVVSDGTNWLIG